MPVIMFLPRAMGRLVVTLALVGLWKATSSLFRVRQRILALTYLIHYEQRVQTIMITFTVELAKAIAEQVGRTLGCPNRQSEFEKCRRKNWTSELHKILRK